MITKEHLIYPKKAWTEVTLHDDLVLELWIIPKGTVVQTRETTNFGWIILPDNCKDKRDFIIPKRVFKW